MKTAVRVYITKTRFKRAAKRAERAIARLGFLRKTELNAQRRLPLVNARLNAQRSGFNHRFSAAPSHSLEPRHV
jgi:hypothetical protein